MRKLMAISAAILLASCGASPIKKESSGNPEMSAALLAVVDGCKIFVVSGGLTNIYFAHCNGSQTTQWETSCGKGQTCRHEVATVEDAEQ